VSAVDVELWRAANQRYLMAAVGVVRAALERHAGGEDGLDEATAREALKVAADELPAPSALETLCVALGLSPFERDVLLLCAGVELDSSFAARCGAAPTFSLALAALPEAHWSALTPAAALRRWRLIEMSGGDSLTRRPLRIDERILHYLTGVSYLDDRLHGLLEPVPPAPELPPSHRALAEQMVERWAHDAIHLCAEDASDARAMAAAAGAGQGMSLYALRAADVPAAAAERDALATLVEREAALSGCALLLEYDGNEGPEAGRWALALVERLRSPLIVSGREPLRGVRRPLARFDVPRPGASEQQTLWRDALGDAAAAQNGLVDRMVSQFRMSAPAIRAVGAEARRRPAASPDALGEFLWDACRAQARPRLDDLARRIAPAATWEQLVLPEPQRETLRTIAAHVRQQAKVYETWGFAARGARGLGVGALFAGPSGTGKTMAAEILANELRLDLYHIDLSQVVSKYIGETEKNLRRVFDAAESGGAILFFDEADALFGKRTEVRDSHDRYANIEVSYLLQRMEAYRGLAILTTNMKSALDPAFLRRLRFVVQFPFPEPAQRAEIWRRIFPSETPTGDLDVARLARLSVAGGNIRNMALHAAFLAADAGEPVAMPHLLRAARAEYAKLEKPLPEAEVEGWA
jgi:ATPase family protein associated with various cellular activities (AAA)/winged helix domain-containing protein